MWRSARPEDDSHVIALCAALYEEDPGSEPVPVSHHARTLETLRRDPLRGVALVLEEDGAVRGYAFLVAVWSNELGGEVVTIDELYVTPSHRRRGLSTALIRALGEPDGPWTGRPVALELEVTPDNARARALYERLGFRIKRNSVLRKKLP
ncbi:MAG: N-acetyltransferase family protein [Sandaracinaceae bacterium]